MRKSREQKFKHKHKQYVHSAFREGRIRLFRLLPETERRKEMIRKAENSNRNPDKINNSIMHITKKSVVTSTLTFDALACLSLNDILLRGCFRREFVATEPPFEVVNITSALFPSLLFFTKVEETFLGPEGFSFLVLP